MDYYIFGHEFSSNWPSAFGTIDDKTSVWSKPKATVTTAQYRFTTIYVKHDNVPIADCLSHNVQAESALADETINIIVAAISMFQEGKINQIKCKTSKDLTLVK